MPHYAVAASVLLVRTEVVEAKDRDELEAVLKEKLSKGNRWDLSQFEVDDATVQAVVVEPQAKVAGIAGISAA